MKIKFWLFCLSIALNVFFAGIYMSDRLSWLKPGKRSPLPAMPYEALGLSDGQRAVFEAERDRFHGRLRETGQTIRHRQAELIDLLAKEKPDRAAIMDKQQEILKLQDKLQSSVISHILDVSEPLDRGQRDQFFALLKQRVARHAQTTLPGCY
jgi:Spy/CpxP family protein refolding chaperone